MATPGGGSVPGSNEGGGAQPVPSCAGRRTAGDGVQWQAGHGGRPAATGAGHGRQMGR